MNKLAIVLLGAQLLLVGCASSERETIEPLVAADPITTTTPAEPASTPAPAPASAPVVERRASAIDVANPVEVAAYCTARDAARPQRGSMTNAAAGDDITARIEGARLVLHVAHAATKGVHVQHGRERIESWSEHAFTVDADAEKDAFAVGTYESAGNEGSGGGITCWAADGVGGGTSFRASPVRLVITKRTDALIEGTFDDTAFSAVLTTEVQAPAEVCCL